MLSLESEKPRYTPRQDADRELPILMPLLYKKAKEKAMITFQIGLGISDCARALNLCENSN